jgi:transposase
VAAAIAGAHLPLAVVNPAQVRHFAQAVGKRAKTDPIDAAVIARFAEAVNPEPRELPDEAGRLLAELVSRRVQLIEMLVAERQREKRASATRVRKSLARHIAALEKEPPVIDNDIDTMVRGSPVWRERRTCWSRFRVSAISSPAPSWRTSPNSAGSPAAGSQALAASRRSRVSPVNGKVAA